MRSQIIEDPNDYFKQRDVNEWMQGVATALTKAAARGADELMQVKRHLCQTELFYLGFFVLGIKKMYSEIVTDYETGEQVEVYHPWIFNRCKEVESEPDFRIDIWAREHFKSTIITLLKSVQDILNNPEIAICIFSYNSTIAKKFVKQIRNALETNELRELFPDIIPDNTSLGKYTYLDENGKKQTRKFSWSDDNFSVIRKTGRKEPTVSGYGLVNSQPTGMHFDLLVYDDVVTPDSVRTQQQNEYTTEQWKMSLNTGAGEAVRMRVIGTRYDKRDTYFHIINPGYATTGKMGGSRFKMRVKPCMLPDGTPVLYTKKYLEMKQMIMHGFVWATQMMCNPQESSTFRFMPEWIEERCKQDEILKNRDSYNFYIFVDPANTQNKSSDYTSMVVVATGEDRRYYVVDGLRDKIQLSERSSKLFTFVQRWTNSKRKPLVFYEQSGLSTDIVTIQRDMAENHFHFDIKAVTTKPRLSIDSRMSGVSLKAQRIQALEPLFRRGDIVLAECVEQVTFDGRLENVISKFIDDEYLNYPFTDHDDFLDALSRIADLESGPLIIFPNPRKSNLLDMEYRRKGKSSMDIYAIKKDRYVPY